MASTELSRDSVRDGVLIRAAGADDVAAIAAIYGAAVLHGTGTFEIVPPDTTSMAARYARIVAAGYPYLVATTNRGVLGFAYANAYRERAAYRFTVEDSVYVAEEGRRQGIGHALLDALVAATTARGLRQMIAVIGDSANAASIQLHVRCGFAHAGVLPASGWKAGRWIDSVLMQRPLGHGATQAPADPT